MNHRNDHISAWMGRLMTIGISLFVLSFCHAKKGPELQTNFNAFDSVSGINHDGVLTEPDRLPGNNVSILTCLNEKIKSQDVNFLWNFEKTILRKYKSEQRKYMDYKPVLIKNKLIHPGIFNDYEDPLIS